MLNRHQRLMLFGAVIFAAIGGSVACNDHASDAQDSSIELTIVDPSLGATREMRSLEDAFTRSTGIRIRSVMGSERTSRMFDEQRDWLKAGSTVPDVCFLDNVWAGSLANYLVDLSSYVPQKELSDIIPEVLKAYVVEGRLIAVPNGTNFPILLYRADLLKEYGFKRPPETWGELERMALAIQTGERKKGNKDFWGYVWEGAATEALTCVGQEYQISSGGGQILEVDHTVSVNNRRALRAFERATGWINRISPIGTSAYVEEDVQNVWEAGNAAFARNWIEAYSSSQSETVATRGKFGIAVMPHDPGEQSASTVGGWGFGVSRNSRHRKEAAGLVRFLTDRSAQKWRLENLADLPALASLYSDRQTMNSVSFLSPIQATLFRSGVARPSSLARDQYAQVSATYARELNSILTKRVTAAEGVARLERELVAITGFTPRAVR